MLDELVNQLKEKVGLSDEQAQKACDTAIEFVKSKLPGGLSDKLDGLLSGGLDLGGLFGGGGDDTNANQDGNSLDALKGMFGGDK